MLVVSCVTPCELFVVCVYLHRHSVCQSPDGHCVQTSISQVHNSAAQHLHISAAVQLVPQFQLIFANTKQHKHSIAQTPIQEFIQKCPESSCNPESVFFITNCFYLKSHILLLLVTLDYVY